MHLAAVAPTSLAVSLLLLGAPVASGAARTDVRAVTLSAPRVALRALGGSHAQLVVRNPSSVVARKVVVAVVLSRDGRRDARDRVVGSATLGRLRAGARRQVGLSLVVPGAVAAGRYWLIGCAEARGQAQVSTANDCARATRRVTVGSATAPVVASFATLEGLAVSRRIGTAGGTLRANVAGGVSATLTVPARALSVPTTIRLVPVATLAGTPPGLTPLVSVVAEPEGLVVPGATLAFAVPGAPSAASLAAIAFGGEDETIVPAPLLRGAGLRVDATTLGGYGVAVAAPRRPGGATPRAAAACNAESLRKRALAIAAAANPRTMDDHVSLAEALLRFEVSDVLPAMRAAVAAGASPDEISPFVSLAVSIERQAQLLGVDTPTSVLHELGDALARAGRNEIGRCAARTQGPARTSVDVTRIRRSAALLGAPDPDLEAQLVADCLSKPYLLGYEMTTTEHTTVIPPPPAFVGGTGTISGLELPYPLPGAAPLAVTGPMTFGDLTCEPGSFPFVGCAVDSANAELEAKIVEIVGSLKPTTRCGRPVKEPAYDVVIQLGHPSEEQHMTVLFQPPTGPPQPTALLGGGAFDRALTVATDGELQRVTLPDDGGSELLLGSTGNFHGSFLAIDATGNATLALH